MLARLVFATVDVAARKGPAESGATALQKFSPYERADKVRGQTCAWRYFHRNG
jgi:hypothetical protein